MNAKWVDFRELREKLRFADLLKEYGVELTIRGARASGFCPLPNHQGTRKSPSFSANLERGIFQCFGCGGKGNVLDFAALMEGVDPSDPQALRQVALKLQDKFLGGSASRPPKPSSRATPATTPAHPAAAPTAVAPAAKREASEAKTKPSEVETRPVVVNAPLDFELKALVAEHPYLKSRGITAQTIAYFGLGYCARGLMQGRIAIPLHDPAGQLIGYAGRLVDEGAICDENPKYRFPSAREREGKVYEFHKSLFLYHGHRILAPVQDLVVVEGFPSVWWLHQHGYADVVALMGARASREQVELLAKLTSEDGRLWLMPDGDDAGDRCAQTLFVDLGPHRFLRWVTLEDGEQPTDCDAARLAVLLPGLGSGQGGGP